MINNKFHAAIGYRPTWAEVNLDNLSHNFRQIKKLLSARTKIMVTVKADAYGHGLIPVARRLVLEGADYLGVASIDEGIKLRRARITRPILIMGMVLKNDIGPLFKYRLTTTVCTRELALALNRKGRLLNRRADVHIKVDTGMGRLGAMPEDTYQMLKGLAKLKFLNIEGIFTHFAFADMNRKFTEHQIGLFNGLIDRLKAEGLHIPLSHAANSIGILDYKNSHFNMVRPGLILYGLYPRENLKIRLKPVLSLKTRVVYGKRMPAGCGISYGHDYITTGDTTVVVLPIGYGDGYPRNLSGKGPVLIRGKKFTISGKVCMDQIMVDLGGLRVRIGEEAVLIGSQGSKKITAEELAGLSGTIPYEIVCGLGSRIPRLYIPR